MDIINLIHTYTYSFWGQIFNVTRVLEIGGEKPRYDVRPYGTVRPYIEARPGMMRARM